MRSIEVEAHFLGESENVYSDYKQSQLIASTHGIKFSAFDTLSGFQSTVNAVDARTYMEVRQQAAENLAGGINLEARVRGLMKTLGVDGETQLTDQTCKELCQSGLVVDLMFLPYCGLKDYVAAMSVRSSLSYRSNL